MLDLELSTVEAQLKFGKHVNDDGIFELEEKLLLTILTKYWHVCILDVEHLKHDGGVTTSHDIQPPERVGRKRVSHNSTTITTTNPWLDIVPKGQSNEISWLFRLIVIL